jgi:hypothetical protein
MATTYTPKQLKRKFEDWAKHGLNYAVVMGQQKGLEPDRAQGVSRAPRKSGNLASTIRITQPTLKRAIKTGLIETKLVAGSKSKAIQVFYSSVHQNGFIVRAVATGKDPVRVADRTKAHIIAPRAGHKKGDFVATVRGGRSTVRQMGFDREQRKVLRIKLKTGEILFRRQVKHPGSKFKGHKYLTITVENVRRGIDAEIQTSVKREIG